MRCIAQYAEYSVQIRPQRSQGMGDGSITVTQEGIYAKFDSDGILFDAEVDRAEKQFPFRGRTQHVDEATPSDIRDRLSVLDTEKQGWDEETRLKVEAELRRKEPITGHFFISEERPVDAPFPAWDTSEKPAFELVASLVEMGFDLNDALYYEKMFGPGRESVIEALEETLKDQQLEEIPA